MSTLLEIKSSVLRQVQACPSFLRKTGQEPDSSAHLQEPATGAWKPGDGVEFFAHMRFLLKKGDGRQGLPCPEVNPPHLPCPEEEVLTREGSEACVPPQPARPGRTLGSCRPQVEMLYEEALYTVLHRAGTMDPDQVDDEAALLGYLQQVFGTSPEEHAAAMERVKKAKAPTYALKVSVVRAKNLLAKDPNGEWGPGGPWLARPGVCGGQRAEGRLLRPEALPDAGFSDPYCMLGILPASGAPREPSGQKEQRFGFRKGSKRSGPLPAKCIQVTEVKNSTLNPVWKEDFLFEIEDVSADQLHLDIWDHDDDVSLAEACRKLNEVIGLKGMSRCTSRLQYPVGPPHVSPASHGGCVGGGSHAGLTLLPQEVPVAGADRWFKLEPRSSASRVQGDCHLVLKLITTQRDTALSQSGRSGFLSHLLLLSRVLRFEHRVEEPDSSRWRGELSAPATTVLCLHGAQSNLSPLQLAVLHWQVSSRHHQTRTLDYGYLLGLLEDLQAHWEEAASLPQEQEESLADSFSAFSEFGLRLLRQLRDYFPATNSTAVAEEAWVLTEELNPKMSLEVAAGLFELYLTLADTQRFWSCVPGRDSRSLALGGLHTPFLPAVKLWLQVLRDQAKWRLQGAVDTDSLEPVDSASKHSSSATTASLCLGHIQELWVRLAWPDPAQAQALGTQLSQDMCETTLFYTELLRKKVDSQPAAAGEVVSQPLCVVLNNVEVVRRASGQALRGLAWPEGASGVAGALPRALLGCTQALDEDLQREARTVTAHLTSKMVADIRKYVQHISLSPDSIQNDEAVAPLMKYLDEKLARLSASLVKENLTRVLEALWELLLQAVLQALGANSDVSTDFYGRFHFTLEALVSFFHAEGQGLPLESLRDGSYKRLEEELRLHRCSTRECIEQFYLDKLKQRALEQNRFGRLSVRCHYEVAEQRLAVEVLHAADLLPLDTNGLSDPFVIVELGPPHLFPLVRSQRTQVKTRTLHPVYDELFHFSVPVEACRRSGACVVFTVMDHDWLSTNDFAGEAALSLSGVSGVLRPQARGGARAGQPVTLHLRRPRAQVRSALRMLEGRNNKEAQEFVKKLKELEKCMEADP
ncbi:PREDICTED: BAI1-associated protein 3 [Dipodomys ordii]|uniref:BAI1-associated protein 3 n=1 Tax=Dipodomys ordii TaxID=10020 RepID=A0A1S3ES34_DIPOR|nr:PREDICTED: BAI1-associated protein 3 [Dipodomys ordii]